MAENNRYSGQYYYESCNACGGAGIIYRANPDTDSQCVSCAGRGSIQRYMQGQTIEPQMNNYHTIKGVIDEKYLWKTEEGKPDPRIKRDVEADLQSLAIQLSISLKKMVYGSKEEQDQIIQYFRLAREIEEYDF